MRTEKIPFSLKSIAVEEEGESFFDSIVSQIATPNLRWVHEMEEQQDLKKKIILMRDLTKLKKYIYKLKFNRL
jgi:hypothetical protein